MNNYKIVIHYIEKKNRIQTLPHLSHVIIKCT